MSKLIKLRKGLDVNLKGKAALETVSVKCPGEYALVPDDFCGMKPKVVVNEGDTVLAGDALFVDKKHPEVKFVSPVSGTVTLVERGDRRKLLSVRVKSDGKQQSREFDVKGDIKAVLMESGMFAFFRQRPYDVVANPEDKPKAIFVSAFNSMPLSQDFSYVVKGQEEEFKAGIKALSAIAKVNLGISVAQSKTFLNDVPNCEVTVFDGPAPAGNVGVQINHVDPINKGEVVWTIAAEEVIFVGRLMKTGRVDLTRTIAVAGSEVKKPAYATIKVGQKLDTLLQGQISDEASLRIINGNVMTGIKTSKDGYLAAHATEINVIPEG
ncbi:MAG: NADH:ubiquinone reductase (Na(+)-transporting) subunit A, partial [Bacteroidaceae bacterium]|nr:NADH:ubiquinone reductase (Na(+)-transporting) subunit A [Bacteroidaceae bacterium]